MSDCKMNAESETSDGCSVQDMEKSCNNLRLSERKEQGGVMGDNSSLCGDHQYACRTSVSQAGSGSSLAGAMEDPEQQNRSVEHRSMCGASSAQSMPLQSGAGGGPGQAKAMTSPPPHPPAPDMMSMMMGGGMPFPDMMSMMSKGGMPPMMDKAPMQGGPMEMARMFNCIIDMTLAKADSDNEDDKEASAPELPCQYCCRLFSNHMALKTHILVAHEQDDSVLNLTQLTISKTRKGFKDGSHSFGQSRGDEAFASSGTAAKTSSTSSEGPATQTGLAAAESVSVRGVKRGRIESKDLETVETGGASGMEDPTGEEEEEDPLEPSPQQDSSDFFETPGSLSDQESKQNSVESVCRSKPKRSKAKHLSQVSPDSGKCQEGEVSSTKPLSCKDAVNKKLKTAVTAHKDELGADRSSPDVWMDAQSLPAAAASGPAEVTEETPPSVRRSLRPRSSNY